ncbi:S-adenosylmethionine-dependent methyltransferase Rv2258c-like [Amphiura filiformis]|uniref:S-adenosylmethionine-dependent methyltransferase Rv2258c-like n=1 Tax=Amphiura filiformis TaxID=82378 RepID=UPI003B210EB6
MESKNKEATKESSEDFEAYLQNAVHGGYVCMAIGIGLDTGLWQVLCDLDGRPKTAREIADRAGLKERYVREWLGTMVMAKIVNIKEDQPETYYIPEHRIPVLHPRRGKTVTLYAKTVSTLSGVSKDVVERFKKDGPNGIAFHRYSDYEASLAEVRRRWLDDYLIQEFIPTVVGLQEQLESGINVLDLGCENGVFVNILAQTFPNSRIYGVDISQDYINAGEKSAQQKGLKNAFYTCCDAAQLDAAWSNQFHYVFISDSLHDFAYADKVLEEIHRVMNADGQLSIIDTYSHTKLSKNQAQADKLLVRYVSSLMYCLPLSLNYEGSLGLGANWGIEAAVKLLEDCGFESKMQSTPGRSGLHFLCTKKTL